MKTLRKIFRTQAARMVLVLLLGIIAVSLLLGFAVDAGIGLAVGIGLTIIVGALYGIDKAITWVMNGDFK